MALESKAEAALALHRFGFGPRPGSIAEIASDPRGALLAELDRANAGQIDNPDLLTSSKASMAAYNFRLERRAVLIAKQEADKERAESGMAMEASMEPKADAPAQPDPAANVPVQIFRSEAKARFDAAVNADIGFVERLVWFWSNHFCISADSVPSMAGAYEREAIRPHVLGRFAEMLLAVESHPAMLFYLDNSRSIGPKSVAGLVGKRGLNENLARETLELHTLGVRTGYTQDDVTRFAKVLTGWSIIPSAGDPEHGSEYVFNARMHEPGPQTVIGKTYAQTGVDQGRAVLAHIARHPATATHLATKLVRHFVADEPPPDLVEMLAQRFRDTDGDLKEVAKALISAPVAWTPTRSKFKRPGEWRMSTYRIVGLVAPDTPRILNTLVVLGEPLWRPPSPKGFAEDEGAWIDGMAQRLDIANSFAARVAQRVNAAELVDDALGPLASPETRQTVARAESRLQALTLLFMAPEFQRR